MMDYEKIPEYAPVLRKLLKGALSRDADAQSWEVMLRNQSAIEGWLEKIGIGLFFDENEGYAFLKDNPPPEEYTGPDLPRFMTERRLDFRTTLLCVLLRERLLEHDQKAYDLSRAQVTRETVYEMMAPYFKSSSDEYRFRQEMDRTLNNVIKLKLIREAKSDKNVFLIERIIKAKISANDLEEIKQKLSEGTQHDELPV